MNDKVPLWQAIDGFFDYQDLYDMFVKELQHGDTIVEVGSYLGQSACYLGHAVLNSQKDLHIICVDQWPPIYTRDDGFAEVDPFYTFLANIRQSRLEGFIVPLRTSSFAASRMLADGIGAVFIDARHDYASVKDDIRAWLPKVRKGGFLTGHDYSDGDEFPGVKKAVDELLPEHERYSLQCWLQRI